MTHRRDSFDRWPNLDALFAQALDTPADARDAFLDSACRGDAALRRELETLLAAHDDAASFLESPADWLGEVPAAPAPPVDEAADRVAPWIGRTLSHYEVLEPIGAGGMGVLVKARDTQLDRLVTLKFLQPFLGTQPVALQRFLQEAQAASALDHPNICTIYGIDETPDGQRFIAMAYYAGETLKDRLARGPVPADEALTIAERLGAGLARAHEAGIVHRDLKPANVMLTERGDVKILDFGIAKLDGSGDITESGARMGTAAYMSPEQARGDEVDHRTDVWSLGVVLYEMLTGQRPFRGDNEQAVIYGILNEEPTASDAVPENVDAVVRTALAKDLSGRYADMSELLGALRAVRAGRRPSRLIAKSRRRVRQRVMAFGGIGVVAALAVLAVLTLGDSPAAPDAPPALLVLPFTNVGEPENDYFAEGVTEEIVQRLTTLPDVRVLARTTARQIQQSGRPLADIADSLGISYVLEGTVRWARREDGSSRVRIAPRFVRLADGTALWSEPVEGELADIFHLQAEIAERVAGGLELQFREDDRRPVGPTENLEAYNAYLVGQYHVNRRDVLEAIASFELAVTEDSGYALAWAGLATALSIYPFYFPGDSAAYHAFPRAEAAARRALEIEPELAEAYAALGWAMEAGRWDFDGAQAAFDRAIELKPTLAAAYHWRSQVLLIRGESEAALRDLMRAVELDPLHAAANTNVGYHLALAERYDEALVYLDRAISLRSDFLWPHADVAYIRSRQGRWDLARAAMRRTLELSGVRDAEVDTVVAGFGPEDGPARRAAVATLDRWATRSDVHPSMPGWFFTILGESEKAVDWLLMAHEVRDPNPMDSITLLRLHLHDPRAREALRALGLP